VKSAPDARRRAVVVGGQGFLGASVVRELVARGDDVTVVDRVASQSACDTLFGAGAVRARPGDIRDRSSLRAPFRGADEVYHFAGRLGTSELDEDIVAAIDANISGTVNVFEAAIAADVRAVFYPSKPDVWLNTYTITKRAADHFASLFGARGLRIAALKYFNAYGPGQALGPVRKLIPTFAVHAIRGEPLPVYGDGEQTVDMIYSADVGRITVDYLRADPETTPIDLGRGIALSVNEVAAAVNALLSNPAGTRHLPMRRGETPGTRLVADLGPLQRVVGPLAFADWETSLATTLSSYEAEVGAVRRERVS
jgi:UDP-glucose 4-epimerase